MKLFMAMLLGYFLGIGYFMVQAEILPEPCGEDEANQCIEALMTTVNTAGSRQEMCEDLKEVVNCFKTVAANCNVELDAKDVLEIEEGLNCGRNVADVPETEEEKCLKENENYLFQCIPAATALTGLLIVDAEENIDDDVVQCLMYRILSACLTERAEEKCGAEASKQVLQLAIEDKEEAEEVCSKPSVTNFMFDKKKK